MSWDWSEFERGFKIPLQGIGSVGQTALRGIGRGAGEGLDAVFEGLLGDNWVLYLIAGGVLILVVLLKR